MSRAGFRNASLYKGAGVEFVGGATIISSGRQPDLRSAYASSLAFVTRRSLRQLDSKIVWHFDLIGLEGIDRFHKPGSRVALERACNGRHVTRRKLRREMELRSR